MNIPETLRRTKIFLTGAIILGLSTLTVAMFKKGELPAPAQISAPVLEDPEQSDTDARNFVLEYRGGSYGVQPLAGYSISGVVVSHNNVSGIGDIYHTSESVDLKDLCLVWGENVQSGIYRKINYWSEPWSCHYRYDNRSTLGHFRADQLSNNHLIASSEAIQNAIRSVNIGDQVRLTGLLVNYYPEKASEQLRKTSLKRTDTGNGACEVIFVSKIEILKRATEAWYLLYAYAEWLTIVAGILKLVSFVLFPWLEFRFT